MLTLRARGHILSAALILTSLAGTANALDNAAPLEVQQAPANSPQLKTRDGAELLPIRKITLYRSGVGAFERQGAVDGSAKVQLKFDISQINDIIKSLQLLDLSGGQIES